MRGKIVIVIISLIMAFFTGGIFGLGYYYFVQGPAKVSATPLENSAPIKELAPKANLPQIGEEDLAIKDELTETVEEPVVVPVPKSEPVRETEIAHEDQAMAEDKVAYITIDDGPDAKNTPAILKILDDYGVKATFFVIGTSIEKNPDLIKQIHEAGHVVGNHTYNHRYNETYASDESFWQSVKQTEELVFNIIGVRPILIREPGGKFRTMPEKQQMVREEGYGLVHWNIDSYDSRSPIPNSQTIFENVKRQAKKERLWPAMVMLFHENSGHQSTVEALPLVIEYLQEEGFSLKTVIEMDIGVMADLPKP